MGHWNETLYDIISRNEDKRIAALENGKTVEVVEPDLDRDFPLDENAADYVHFQLPDRKIPSSREQEKLKKTREKAFKHMVAGSKRRVKILKDALDLYGHDVKDATGNVSRQCFVVDKRSEEQHIPLMKSDADVANYLKNYLGTDTTPVTRIRMLLQNIKDMIRNVKNNPLMDPNQTDEYLAEHYWDMMSLSGPCEQGGPYIKEIIDKLKEMDPKAITADEEKEYLGYADDVERIMLIHTELVARYNTILSPLYLALGDSKLTFADAAKLSDLTHLPNRFLNEEYEPLAPYLNLNTDFDFGYDLRHMDIFKEKHPELLTEPLYIYSADNGSMKVSAINKCKSFCVNEKIEKDGKLVPGRWRRFKHAEDGAFVETEVTPEESKRMQITYDALKKEENDHILNLHLFSSPVFTADGIKTDYHVDNRSDVGALIMSGGGFYYCEWKNENKEMHFHHVALDFETGNINDNILSKEDWITFNKNWAKKEKNADLTDTEAEILSSERIGAYEDNVDFLKVEVNKLRQLLSDHTRPNHSNTPYKNVEIALEDFLNVSDNLSTAEKILMLQRIIKLAEIYLSDEKHAEDRKTAMNEVSVRLAVFASSMVYFKNNELLKREGNKKQFDVEPILRTLRRSMRNMPFDADAYAFWKAAGVRANVSAIRNSEAVLFMAEHLKGKIKDEKELDRIVDIFGKAMQAVAKLSGLADDAFIKKYNEILANTGKAWKIGNAAFDEALHDRMVSRMNREVIRRNLDIVPGKPAGPESLHAFSYKKRERMISAWLDEKARNYANLEIKLDRSVQRAQEAFAHNVFGVSYGTLTGRMPSGYKQGCAPYVVTVCLLLDAGLKLDEIMDPNAQTDKKREIGKKITEILKEAKGNDQKLRDRVARSLAKHGEALMNYKPEQAGHLDIDHSEEVLKYAGDAGILMDGIFDAFTVSTMTSFRWDSKNQEHTCRVFAEKDETPEQTRARIRDLSARIRIQYNDRKLTLQSMKDKGRLYSALRVDHDVFEQKEFSKSCIKALMSEKLLPFVRGMKKPSTTEERYLMAYAETIAENLDRPMTALLKSCPMQVLLALIMNPAYKERLQIVANPDYIRKLPGQTEDEKQTIISKNLKVDRENFGYFLLKDKAGNELKVSTEMLNGDLNEEEEAFMTHFNNEILDDCAEKEKQASARLQSDIQKTLQQLPQSMQDCRKLFNAAPEFMNVITRKIDELRIVNYNKGAGNAFSNIIIGNRNGTELLKAEAVRRGLDIKKSENITGTLNILFASICAAALKQGLNISMVRANNNTTVTKLNMSPEVNELFLAPEMQNSKACSEPLAAVWKEMSKYFKRRKTKEEGVSDHKKAVDKACRKMTDSMDKQYLKLHPELKQLNPFKTMEIAMAKKTASDLITDALGKHAPTVKGYEFADKITISRDSAIIAIAYALDNDSPDLGEVERFTFTGNENELGKQQSRLQKAAQKYAEIVNRHKTDPKDADMNMRYYLAQAMSAMGKSDIPETIPDMGEYVIKYAADLKARREVFRAISNSKAPVGFGLTRADKARAMKDFQNGTVILDCDLAAEEYLVAAEKAENIYDGTKVLNNLKALQRSVCRQVLFMNKLSDKPKPVAFAKAVKTFDGAQENAIEMVKTSMDNLDDTNDYTPMLESTMEQAGVMMQAGKNAVNAKQRLQKKENNPELQ